MSQFYHSDISTIYIVLVLVVLSNSLATLAMGEHKLRKVGGAVRWLRVIHLVCLCQWSRMWHCSSSRHHGAMVDCLYQWTRDQGSIVTADCVTWCGQVPVMIVTSATGASADLLRHEKNIINIYRAAGDHLPHRSSR